MMLPEMENLAQIAIAHVLNSLPEGILIAALAWLMLRFLPRQNSRTRFATWLLALLTVAGVPFISASRSHFPDANDGISLFTLSDRWAFVLFSVWLLGVALAMAHLLLGIWRLHSLRKTCQPIVAADMDPALRRIAADFCSTHSVLLATSDELNVPSAIGFFQPMIVIPQWVLHDLTAEEFHVILLHEFAHLRRRDDWTNLLQKTVRALFIFHPAVWWIERQLSIEREMACDDHVLCETGNPHGYAKCLVALLERSLGRRAVAMAQAAVRRADEARERLLRILDANRSTSGRFGAPAIGLAGILCLLCLAVVPHAPELLAFAPSASQIGAATVPKFAESKLGSASVIPAAMHLRTTQAVRRSRANGTPATTHAIAAKAKVVPAVPRAVKARANQRALPPETILVIRTTEQIGPDAWVSHVTVWRLRYVPSRTERTSVPKTT